MKYKSAPCSLLPAPLLRCMLIILTLTILPHPQAMITNTYSPDTTDFANPERGWITHAYLSSTYNQPSYFMNEWNQRRTVILCKINLETYANSLTIPGSVITEAESFFNNCRTYGIKANLRIMYDDSGAYLNQNLTYITNHLEQLRAVLSNNADVLNVIEAGCVGPWGEWHNSSLIGDTAALQTILYKLLDVVPTDRMVVLRTPKFKRDLLGSIWLNVGEAFSQTARARTGFHNDCFLADSTDMGTYTDRAAEMAYIHNETQYTPFGGETCPPGSVADCANALYEQDYLHASYMHKDWYAPIYADWVTNGCSDEITRRYGYRYFVSRFEVSETSKPGGLLRIKFDITNSGFAARYNYRKMYVVLHNAGNTYSAEVAPDIRWWQPETSITEDWTLVVPDNIVPGDYNVSLHIPDNYASIAANTRYSIRFANTGTWDQATGYNIMHTGLNIDSGNPGDTYCTNQFIDTALHGLPAPCGGGGSNTNIFISFVQPSGVAGNAWDEYEVVYNYSYPYVPGVTAAYYYSTTPGYSALTYLDTVTLGASGQTNYQWLTADLPEGQYFFTVVATHPSSGAFTNQTAAVVNKYPLMTFLSPAGTTLTAYESLTITYDLMMTDLSGAGITYYYSETPGGTGLNYIGFQPLSNTGIHNYSWEAALTAGEEIYGKTVYISAVISRTGMPSVTNSSATAIYVRPEPEERQFIDGLDFKIYPNPFFVAADFDNVLTVELTNQSLDGAQAYVYTMSGELVTVFEPDSEGEFSWDGAVEDEGGRSLVFPGIYLVRVMTAGGWLEDDLKLIIQW